MNAPDGQIEPDTKDWTWTLERPCDECGFEAGAVPPEHLAPLVAIATAPWPAVLARPDVRDRRRAGRWSELEYACHVRDVCRVFTGRLELMLDQDRPHFADWDQDDAAARGHYRQQDPAQVATELGEAAAALRAAYADVAGDQWQRSGLRSSGSAFTVLTLGQYCVHDLVHHLYDVRAPLPL